MILAQSLIIICGVFGFMFLIKLFIYYKRWKEFRDWEIDDKIILNGLEMINEGIVGKPKIAYVAGWSYKKLFIYFSSEEQMVELYAVSWKVFSSNKSAIWRRYYEQCKSTMGKKPRFDKYTETQNKPSDINELDEQQCRKMLQRAIDSENYELAEQLKNRLEKLKK